ncbi:M15 family peptidase [Mesorhizobium loti R88b]|uniref:M15 family peptidase n=2 Tax=Rhizobium loti TaxID=381 RepID=A0A6M7WQ64_RHILI|nr:M15 family peptidase [Mesorhizobium loti R88b]
MRDAWAQYLGQENIMALVPFGPTRLRVAPPSVDAWRALEAVLDKYSYQIRKSDTAAYANRAITGGTKPSLHAYGIAADVDWQTNPYKKTPDKRQVIFSNKPSQDERALDVRFGRADTDMTPQMIDEVLGIVTVGKQGVFAWGGNFRSSKDTMHFQLDVTPEELSTGIDWPGAGQPDASPPPTTGDQPEPATPAAGTQGGASMNRAVFYNEIRDDLFGGALSKAQVAGMEDVLNVRDRLYPSCDDRWLAYILATVYHETGRRMVPVREGFASTDDGAIAAVTRLFNEGKIRVNYAIPVNGVSYFGRGRVQNTWLANYRKLETRFQQPFVNNPGLLISRPDIDAEVTVTGHVEGIWTGRKLSDFINNAGCDYTGARSIVSSDRAGDIAGYAVNFENAIRAAAAAGAPVSPAAPQPAPTPTAPDPQSPQPQGGPTVPSAPDQSLATIVLSLQKLLSDIKGLQGGQSGASQNLAGIPSSDIDQIIALLQAIQNPGQGSTDTGTRPLGQVNGALGQTIGNLLDGKKSAIGILGAAATSILSSAAPGSTLGTVAASIPALAGSSSTLLPLFLAMAAWGALGKGEKWLQPAPTSPRAK